MEENKDGKEKEESGTPENSGKGIQSETNKTVDDINLAAKRSEEAAEALRKENDRTENNYAKMKVGGEIDAGKPAEKKEETPKEYNERIDKEMSEGQHYE